MRGFLLLLILTAASPAAFAAEVGHYIPGLVGTKSAPAPGPGFYYGGLFLSYEFGKYIDPEGNSFPQDGDINILGMVNSFIYSTPKRLLRARYVLQVNVPITNRAYLLGPGALNQIGDTGIADIYFQPVNLTWNTGGNHFTVRYGFFAPTGRYKSGGLNNTGKGFWTHMISVGDTLFFGPDKRWHASGMLRYETHTKKENVDVTAGDNAIYEWGVGRALPKGFDLGLVGAGTWQVTTEKRSAARLSKYSAHALGGEIQYAIPKARMSLRFRANFDVRARDRAKGRLIAFMLVWKP
jgi:hypothetical protein